MTAGRPTLRFVTRRGCTLCEEAYQLLAAAAATRSVAVAVSDVDADPDLLAKYGDTVPVVLTEGGEVLWRGPLSRRQAAAIVKKT